VEGSRPEYDRYQPVIPYAYGGGVLCLTSCSICGATVVGDKNQKKHTSFHTEHNELVEWAQSVSELFKPNSPALEERLRGLLHNINDGVITPGEAMARSGIELQEGPNQQNEMEV
jgi:hypothetical protein